MTDTIKALPPSPTNIRTAIVFHDELNPKLWTGDELRLEVRIRLLRTALKFFDFLDVPGLKVSDILITGSNAAYNYTKFSDIDVHLVVDFEKSACPELAENFFNTKRNLWNSSHEISIRGCKLELYVEDSKQPATSNGVYSLLRGAWVSVPEREEPSFDDAVVIKKTQHLADQIDEILANPESPAKVENVLQRLRTMRQNGLEDGGEFSVENLTFKSLRALGYMDRLWQAQMSLEDENLSL